MKKKIIYFLLLIIAGGIAYVMYFSYTYKCPPPERPAQVPQDAKWYGDCDGGEWIYMVPDELKYHFKIYQDYSGELLMDAVFIPENDSIELNHQNWKDKVCYFSYESESPLAYILLNDSNLTKLISQYPAFGGSSWELIKEAYSLEEYSDTTSIYSPNDN